MRGESHLEYEKKKLECVIIKNKNINDVHFYIRSATAASHYYGNLRTWVQRLQTAFILIHIWGLKFLNLISFHGKILPCAQTTKLEFI